MKNEKVAAIVPAYNEAPRIAPVLRALCSVKELDEIIVVDDASTDDLYSVVNQFPKIKYMRNPMNRGKGPSMDAGVKATNASIILFCDSDLRGLQPMHIQKILRPVLQRRYDMYIGLCANRMQKTVKAWALNSGQRAMKRSVWEKLPDFYKKGYRIETGLNLLVKYFGNGYGYETLAYSQYIKEKKHGILIGSMMRRKMNLQILFTTLRFHLYDRFILTRKRFRIG